MEFKRFPYKSTKIKKIYGTFVSIIARREWFFIFQEQETANMWHNAWRMPQKKSVYQ